jgi:hypothetical protein
MLCVPLAAATISGTLKTTAGKPIRAAITIHDLSTPRTPGQSAFDRQFASKSDGTFSLGGIPAGKYEFCVEAPQENALDPCLWTPGGAPTLTVAASDTIANHALTVDTGYMLNLRVNDTSAILPPSKSGVLGSVLSLKIVTGSNRVINFRLLSTDAQGRNHYILIPWNQALTLVPESSSQALFNAANTRITNDSLRIPVRVPKGGSWPTVTINVGQH